MQDSQQITYILHMIYVFNNLYRSFECKNLYFHLGIERNSANSNVFFKSKMSYFVVKKHNWRKCLLYYFFNLKKQTVVAHRVLTEAFFKYIAPILTCEICYLK